MSQPKTITLSPTALDRNGISTTETLAAARLDYLINGALSAGYDRDGIAASQSPASADAMTLNGALGLDFRARRGIYVLLYAAANDTGRTFTVVGEDIDGNRITESITGPGVGLITLGSTKFYHITSVTPDAATAGNIEVGVNGYVDLASAGNAQHVAMYSAGNDSAATITARGYDRYGQAVTDTITGASGGTSTTQDTNFGWVDRISISTGSAGAVEAGVNGLCESGWHVLNYRGPDFNVAFSAEVSSGGSLTYDVEHTFNNVLASGFTETDATVFNHDSIAAQTATADGTYTSPPVAVRAAITTYSSGSLTFRVVQVGRD